MPVFGRRVDKLGGRRRARRQPVALAAAALSLEGSFSVTIEDVGATGARLRSRHLVRAGRELLIRVGAIEIFASVIWSHRDEWGILFDEALGDDVLEALKQEGACATAISALSR